MKELRGRVVAITGAASGIGRALAVRLAEEGCRLALSDVNARELAITGEKATREGVEVIVDEVDVADREAMFAWADRVVDHFGEAHVIVNNAGVTVVDMVSDLTLEDFEWLMGINFWGVIYGSKAFLPHLERAGEGAIVNISSVFGIIASPGQAAYNASKFAVRGFTESLRQELEIAGSPVTAISIHPGGIATNIVNNARFGVGGLEIRRQLTERFDNELARTTPAQAAEQIVAGLKRKSRRVLVGTDAKVIDAVQRILPTGYQRIMSYFGKRDVPRDRQG